MNVEDKLIDEDIYDGQGLITSELLKENFEGFKRNEYVIFENGLKGIISRSDLNDFKEDKQYLIGRKVK